MTEKIYSRNPEVGYIIFDLEENNPILKWLADNNAYQLFASQKIEEIFLKIDLKKLDILIYEDKSLEEFVEAIGLGNFYEIVPEHVFIVCYCPERKRLRRHEGFSHYHIAFTGESKKYENVDVKEILDTIVRLWRELPSTFSLAGFGIPYFLDAFYINQSRYYYWREKEIERREETERRTTSYDSQ